MTSSIVTITVKLSPKEWDDVRECVAFGQENAESIAKHAEDVKTRSAARQTALRLADLRRKFA